MENNQPQPTLGNGKICYIDLPTIDANRAAVFYKEVFGWNIRTNNEGNLSFDDGVGQVSGRWITDRKVYTDKPGMLVYIMVDNMDTAIKAVTTNGGKVVQPVGMDAPEITAHFRDPDGNIFGLYQERNM
jgi:uncharacterized protein